MKDIKNKMKNKLTILCSLMIIVAFLFGCTNQKKLDKEEIEIVTKLINKKLFENEISPIIIDEVYQKYQKDSITDPLVIDSLVRADVTNRKYYVTFSDTLFPIDRKGDLFKETMRRIGKNKMNDSLNMINVILENCKFYKLKCNMDKSSAILSHDTIVKED